MKTKGKLLPWLAGFVALAVALAAVYVFLPQWIPAELFGFARSVSGEEAVLRLGVVETACGWYGAREDNGSHHTIIDLYNSLDPLPQGYRVTYDDAWCAAFVTAAAMEQGLTDIIPPECSCPRQIQALQELGRWEEDDNYRPLPGDLIYYDWDFFPGLDCTGSADHVGIVVGTWGPFIRVMEGNKNDRAAYRTVWQNDWCIRGYGVPDYAGKCGSTNDPSGLPGRVKCYVSVQNSGSV